MTANALIFYAFEQYKPKKIELTFCGLILIFKVVCINVYTFCLCLLESRFLKIKLNNFKNYDFIFKKIMILLVFI